MKSTAGRILNSGVTDVHLLDVVEDLAFFFCVSDQVETGMAAMVGFGRNTERPVTVSRGLMLQALPGCDLNAFEEVRRRLHCEEPRSLLRQTNAPKQTFENLLKALLATTDAAPDDVRRAPPTRPAFACSCSRDGILEAVRTLPQTDVREILEADEPLTLRCRFCAKPYQVTPEQLKKVRKRT